MSDPVSTEAQATPQAPVPDVKVDAKSDVVVQPVEQAPVVPEKYDLKLPKDSPLEAAYVEKFQAEAKAKGLTNEQAQALLERDSGLKATFHEDQKSFLKQKADTWFNEAKSDQEIGGESFKENSEIAKRALDRFASDQLRQVLNDTGLGNHPELIRTFVRVGKLMGDDKLVTPQAQGVPKRAPQDVLYGKK